MQIKEIPFEEAKGYFADTEGNIYSTKRGSLKKLNAYMRWKDRGSRFKHLRVDIGGKKYDVHRLIYLTFKGNIPDDMIVRHVDDNAENNTPDNLILGTRKENSQDSLRNGTFPIGERSGRAVLSEKQVIEMLRLQKSFSINQLAERYNISPSHTARILRGDAWKHINRKEVI